MGAGEVMIVPNETIGMDNQAEVLQTSRPTSVENEILRRQNANQAETIEQLRREVTTFASRLAGVEYDKESSKNENSSLMLTIRNLREDIKFKDEMIKKLNECIDQKNKVERILIRVADEAFQDSIEDR